MTGVASLPSRDSNSHGVPERKMRTSTKRLSGEVRTTVLVGSVGGLGKKRMLSRMDMLGAMGNTVSDKYKEEFMGRCDVVST